MKRTQLTDDHEDGRYYEARLYPNHALMLAALRRSHKWTGEPFDGRNTGAATRHLWSETWDGRRWVQDQCHGAIFLSRENISAELLAHEATHAALGLYRSRHRGNAALGRNNSSAEAAKEEELTAIVGKFTRQLTNFMYDAGVWS